MDNLQERIWKIEDRYRNKQTGEFKESCLPEEALEQYRILKMELEKERMKGK